jgi:hypothetical protein
MNSKILIAVAFSLAMVGLASAAASKPKSHVSNQVSWHSKVSDMFDRHDVNGDGFISRDEAAAYFEEQAAQAN